MSQGLPLLATGGVNYAIPQHRIVADVFTCLRLHTTLDAAGRRLEIAVYVTIGITLVQFFNLIFEIFRKHR